MPNFSDRLACDPRESLDGRGQRLVIPGQSFVGFTRDEYGWRIGILRLPPRIAAAALRVGDDETQAGQLTPESRR
jgi:hypothetical protein